MGRDYSEIIRYLFVGVLTTVVSLGTYYGCVCSLLDPNEPVELQCANIISWIVAVTFAYAANRIFVFKSDNSNILKEIGSFFVARISSLLFDMGIMLVMVTFMGMNDKIAKLFVQVVVTVVNYIMSKLFVFKNREC